MMGDENNKVLERMPTDWATRRRHPPALNVPRQRVEAAA